jgi:hypothetical protein
MGVLAPNIILFLPTAYFTAAVSATLVVSALGTAAVSTCAAVESVASFVADPEPHAANAITALRAKIKVYFFIILNIHKKTE